MNNISLKDFKQLPEFETVNFPVTREIKKELRGISIDSRSLLPGDIFWAISGENFNGHNFVKEAVKKGASAVVINKNTLHCFCEMKIPLIAVENTLDALQKMAEFHRKKFRIPIIAITGTNGKTTTKEMLAWILQRKMNVHKTHGNLNNHIGVPLSLLKLDSENEISVIELGTNHPGEIALLSSIVMPTAALITNIGRGHLEYFSSIEGVAREKFAVFKKLKKDGVVFLNNDDYLVRQYSCKQNKVWSYSLESKNNSNVYGEVIEFNEMGEGTWKLNDRVNISLKIAGMQNIKNALAASAVALHFGFSEEEIKDALEKYTPYEKRMQIINHGTITIINDCYNANPDSYTSAIDTLELIAQKQNRRKIVVIGDMLELGLQSETLHQELMLQLLDHNISGIFTLGSESKRAAKMLLVKGLSNVYSFSSHEELANTFKNFIKPKDVILLKGSRGMQMEKLLGYL